METKRLILLMTIGMLVILGWQPLMTRVGTMMGYDMTLKPATQPAAPAIVDAAPVTAAPVAEVATTPGVAPATAAVVPTSGYSVAAATQPSVAGDLSLGSAQHEDKEYALAIKTSAQGAGLSEVVLNDYKLTLRTGEPFAYERPGVLYPNRTRNARRARRDDRRRRRRPDGRAVVARRTRRG